MGSIRGRRSAGAVVAAIVALASWDQGGILTTASISSDGGPEGALSAANPVEATGVSYSLAGQFASTTPRLRIPGVASPQLAPLTASPPAGGPPAGDVEIAAPPPQFNTSAPPPSGPPPVQLRASGAGDARASHDPPGGVTPAAGTWAVLIGVNDYPGDEFDLRSAVNDVNDVDQALAKLGVSGDRRLVLRDGQATAPTIRSAVDWLKAHASPEATAVFFFAGHVRKVGDTTEALLGADGETIEDRELAGMLDGLRAKSTWIGIAACYSGGFTEVLRPGRILTAAAPANSLAYENEAFGRSYLVEYMIRRGMLGKGFTTVEAAFSWAATELKRDYPNRVPVQDDRLGGELDLRPRTASQPNRAPSGGSPPPPPPPDSGSGGGSGGSSPPPDDGCSNLTVGVIRCG